MLKKVPNKDLLGRLEINLDMSSIKNSISNKRILITGAGGSIGSELVKQCLFFKPLEIICIDKSEEKIFELNFKYENKNLETVFKIVLANINNVDELEKIFIENKPQIIFHAAAYKHVPIQEIQPWSSVRTNIGGTYNAVLLSDKYLVENFILISTDKAVNPISIMGATKNIAEKIIQSYNLESITSFTAVRFGNVLGSSGSVVPIFKNQIKSGGPVTITHPDMTRYFMSIQEACQLILQCCSLGENREIFILNMGKQIKILEMAKELIKKSGFRPNIDIPIIYSGLRPGEKIIEELCSSEETLIKTNYKKIMILKQDKKYLQETKEFKRFLLKLLEAANKFDSDKIVLLLKKIIPLYKTKSAE